MIHFLLIAPTLLALVALFFPSAKYRPLLVPLAALVQCGIAIRCLRAPHVPSASSWLALDPFGSLVLVIVSVLFLINSFYLVGYLGFAGERKNSYFCAAVIFLLAMLNLAIISQHIGLMWVAMESATLSVVPLIYFNKRTTSLEAAWKYMLIGGVGIGIALLGTFFLAYAAFVERQPETLIYSEILANAHTYSRFWIKMAFAFLFVGYGTKMGLAPMHTWKPDVYGEASGTVGALLAGGVISCAFLALVRMVHIINMAGEGLYARNLLIGIGLISMALAAVFMLDQKDFKRLLAYSSVEQMGILVLGLGFGGSAIYPTFLHLINNALTKGVMFLAVGNIHRASRSKSIVLVRGMIHVLPFSSVMLVIGFLAVTGSPPFGPFLSEFMLAKAFFSGESKLIGIAFLGLLMLAFIGMGKTIFTVVFGSSSLKDGEVARAENLMTTVPIVVFAAIVLVLGVFIPGPIKTMLDDAVRFYGEFK
jgi:hydrogenase-4 component F